MLFRFCPIAAISVFLALKLILTEEEVGADERRFLKVNKAKRFKGGM